MNHHLEDNMAHGASRLRSFTSKDVEEDLELLKKGILDFHSLLSGYSFHNHPIELTVTDSDGKLKFLRRFHNLRTNAGTADQSHVMSDPSNTVARAYYIALTATPITPSTTDTSLSGELANTYGLGRKAATFTLTNAPSTASSNTLQGTYTLTVSWTVSVGAPTQTIWGCAVFNAASGPDMWLEAAIASPGVVVGAGDTISMVYTINY